MVILKDNEIIVINISGSRYQLLKQTVDLIPGSLLHLLTLPQSVENLPFGVHHVQNRKTFFIQRSAQMFELIILPCYITGKLHVPKWMCAENVIEELKFWQLDLRYACHCCAEESSKQLEETNEQTLEIVNDKRKSSWQRFRELSWEFMDKPSSSVFAMVGVLFSFDEKLENFIFKTRHH